MILTDIHAPALRYFGGKWRLAPWIISYFPPHIAYVEPFGGGASVLLRKTPSYNEIYNDIDSEVVNFFKVLRERPEELIRAIELTPYSREEQRLSFEECSDSLERARRLYVRCWQTHGGGRTQWSSGWRYDISDRRGSRMVDDWARVDHLWRVVERLKKVQIEHDDALNVITRFDSKDTLFFLDPPYLPDTRSKRWRDKSYQFEMNDEQHTELVTMLTGLQGMVVLCGYPSSLYDALLSGWEMYQTRTQVNFHHEVMDCIWLNPAAVERQPQMKFDFAR